MISIKIFHPHMERMVTVQKQLSRNRDEVWYWVRSGSLVTVIICLCSLCHLDKPERPVTLKAEMIQCFTL